MKHPPFKAGLKNYIQSSTDPVRYATIALAIRTIQKNSIKGVFAEAGVYKGIISRFIHYIAPKRVLYLFDTFAGFPETFVDGTDSRFKDTNLEVVKRNLGDVHNVIIKQGIFPETAIGLEKETFAFVMLDLDLYKSTFAGLDFFYPRVSPGGYIFVHDYHSNETGVAKAVSEYFQGKPEMLIEIPDVLGSVIIRKNMD